MALVRAGGYRHRIRRDGPDEYTISWTCDTKHAGSRYRFERVISRNTNRKGAERFAKKHGAKMPPDPT